MKVQVVSLHSTLYLLSNVSGAHTPHLQLESDVKYKRHTQLLKVSALYYNQQSSSHLGNELSYTKMWDIKNGDAGYIPTDHVLIHCWIEHRKSTFFLDNGHDCPLPKMLENIHLRVL